jgi:probable F420-dependent oxidoreductase
VNLDCYSFGQSLRSTGQLSAEAEDIGFDGMWFTESAHNPFLLAGTSLLATESLAVGTNVAVAFARSPMVVAQAAWDLADAGDGRFVLGLGSQVKAHITRRFSMPFSQPAARLREYVLALRAIFAAFNGEEPLRFEGKFYNFSLLTDFFAPRPIAHADIPIYLAGVNERMAHVAGEVANGLCAHPLHSVRYLQEVVQPAVAAGAKQANRDPSEIALAVPVFIVAGDTDEETEGEREAIRRQIAFYGSTPSYRAVFALHGWEEASTRLGELQRQRKVDEMPHVITDDMLDTFSVTASWSGLAPELLSRYAGIASRVLPYGTAGDWQQHPGRAERWGEVATAVRRG